MDQGRQSLRSGPKGFPSHVTIEPINDGQELVTFFTCRRVADIEKR